jgi:hypothetical protein
MGIIGLPNVGKSTLFNALTCSKGAEAANYPFCTIEPNVGVVEVPDSRLQKLTDLAHPEKVIPAVTEFVDIAGLVKGASKGEGLGNQFLHAIREVDALCHLVRFFENSDITHVDGSIEPRRDRETIETELILSDLQSMEGRMKKISSEARTGDKIKKEELKIAERINASLCAGAMASTVDLTDEEMTLAKGFQLLTLKPLIYAMNVSEEELKSLSIHEARQRLNLSENENIITISAKIEEDLQDLSKEDAAELLCDLGVTSSGLDRLIHSAYDALGYITFFTAGPKEVRAWTIRRGAKAPEAAGAIHTDFQKGFIRAETISYDDFVEYGGEQNAKEHGKMRSEGKEYVVQDGDVMLFRFNV